MGILSAIKSNFCLAKGVQGVIETVIETATTSGEIFSVSKPENNTRYVAKGFSKVMFSEIPANPSGDYNFYITYQDTTGFIGTFAGNFLLSYGRSDEEYNPVNPKLNNPDFDITDNYTVIHLHIWYDGINYCGEIDGYE